jgi:UTP-glucose-1-phosphate uridylyltransferase
MSPENLEFVVLAAGKSTRNYPHSKGILHKSLVPFGSVKVIDFIMKQIVLARGKHVTIVVADEASVNSFKQCFSHEPEIEAKFEAKGKTQALAMLKGVYLPEDMDVKYLIQEKPRGTGHAVGRVYNQIRNTGRNIVMIWPDDVVLSDKTKTSENSCIYKRAVDKYISMGCRGNLGITRPDDDPSRWGIIDEGYFKEKPKESKSNQAAFGLFIFDKKVCEKLYESSVAMDEGKDVDGLVGGELAFASALNATIDEDPNTQKIQSIPMLDSDIYLDCGCIEGYEKALLYTLLAESEFKDDNLKFIKPIVDKLWSKK